MGRTKKAALPDQLGEDVMALSRRIKDALDPAGILNPGRCCEARRRGGRLRSVP